MNKRIDFTNIGGFPFTQDTLKFMQESYRGAFSSLAAMIGNKTIVSGVEVASGNVTDGWISYQGELIPFIGGVAGSDIIITENATNATFEDENEFPTYFTKIATCGVGGAFPFAELVRLQALQNIWLPGDIKEKYCNAPYIAANFDAEGYGLNREAGWRILSKAIPSAAGKVMVNLDTTDGDFYAVGNVGGEKLHILSKSELPAVQIEIPIPANKTSQDDAGNGKIVGGGGISEPGALNSLYTANLGNGVGHNNLQPYFVVLKLIKL